MYRSVVESSTSEDCAQGLADREWYAAYTRPQHERAVAQQASAKGLEVLLAIAPIRRNWKQRVVHLSTPLFPGYVFVRMHLEERLKILSVPSVVRLVSFNGKPATIRATEIEAVQACLAHGSGVQPHGYLEVGWPVRIKRGPLAGIEGRVTQRGSAHQLVVSIKLLQLSMAINVDSDDLEPVMDA